MIEVACPHPEVPPEVVGQERLPDRNDQHAPTDEQREEARLGLQKLPRNASPVRLRNRDAIDGRPRGVLSKYGISRVRFRDMAHRGELPGVTKSSW